MKKLVIFLTIMIGTAFCADHSPSNISARLYLMAETIVCDPLTDSIWLCFDFKSDKYCDIPKRYYVEYSDEYGWEINWLGGYKNECIGADHITKYWEYRVSNEGVISEYWYHIDKDYNKVLDSWSKGEVSASRANKQREAIIDFTKNKWFDRSKI